MNSSAIDAHRFATQTSSPPRDAFVWLSSQPTSSVLPCSPWDRWTLIALHDHRRRQAFVETVLRTRIGASPHDVGTRGWSGHPDGLPSRGVVPGHPEWRYRLHGRGCCLSNADGTEIDVDFDEYGSASIDPGFYSRYLESVANAGFIEQRLRLAGSRRCTEWQASLQPLREAGLLEGERRVRVTPTAVDWCGAVSNALRANESDATRLAWIAHQIEDYPLVGDLLGERTPQHLRAASQNQIERRCDDLETRIRSRHESHDHALVPALATLQPERARDVARREIVIGNVDVTVARCMELLADDPDVEDVPAVTALVARLRGTEPLTAHLRVLAASHLLSFFRRDRVPSNVRDTVRRALDLDQGANEGDAAMLVYLLERDDGLRRMHRGLRSTAPLARAECAAGLALLGDAEATAVLRSEETSEAAAALAFLRNHAPERTFEPAGTLIDVDGMPKRVYRLSELMASNHEGFVFAIAKSFVDRFEPILRRWDAH